MHSAPSIWLVDDDEDDRFFIGTAFREINPSIQIVTLDDGDKLLPQLKESAFFPQLILLGVNMPRKNGFEVLVELKDNPRFAAIPVVMLTTSSNEDDRQRALALGARNFIVKPPTFDLLVKLVKELIHWWIVV